MTVLVMMVFIGLYIASVSATIEQNLRAGPREEMLTRGQYAAEAGLHRALVELGKQGSGTPTVTDFEEAEFEGEVTPGSSVSYRVKIVNNHGGTAVETAPDGTDIPVGLAWIQSVGLLDGNVIQGQAGMARRLAGQGTVEFQHVLRSDALQRFATPGAATLISSFDSSTGASPWAPTFVPAVGTTHRTVVAPYQPAVTLRAETYADLTATKVDGHLVAGSATMRVDSGFGTMVKASTDVKPELRIPTRFRMPESFRAQTDLGDFASAGGSLAAGRYANVVLSGSVLLQRGEYYMNSLTIATGAVVTLAPDPDPDPCVLYISGDLDVYGVLGSLDLPPGLLRLYFTDDETGETASTAQLHAGSTLCGVLCGEHLLTWAARDSSLIGALKSYGTTYWDYGADILYDSRLKNQDFPERPEWILINETDD